MDQSIPEEYRSYWQPFTTKMVLYHLTTEENLQDIQKNGLIPRDPAPKHWSGLKAVFLSFPNDPLFKKTQKDVTEHVRSKGQNLVKLHVKTKNQLFRSTDPKRTFQVISLDRIPTFEITVAKNI